MKTDYTKCKHCGSHTEMVMERKYKEKITRRWGCAKCFKMRTEVEYK